MFLKKLHDWNLSRLCGTSVSYLKSPMWVEPIYFGYIFNYMALKSTMQLEQACSPDALHLDIIE